MIVLPELREYQHTMADGGRSVLGRSRAVILQAAPGSGKTRIAKFMLGKSAMRIRSDRLSGFNLFAVYGRGLVDNASEDFTAQPELPHGVLMSGVRKDWTKRIQVGSIDSLLSWYVEVNPETEEERYTADITFDFIVYDECHEHHKKIERFFRLHNIRRKELGLSPGYLVGLSATPEAKGLGKLYGAIVPGPKNQWMIDNGYLSPYRYVHGQEGKLGLLVNRGNQFTDESHRQAMDGLTGELVRDWKRHGEGRPTIGFFRFRAHAYEGLEELRAAGVRAEYVDGDTSDEQRKRLFRDLADGTIEYLCNVRVVSRGTNIPPTSCIQLCEAINSIKDYHQKIGRASRMSPETGKIDSIVIDHGGNVQRLGYFEDDIIWELDNQKDKKAKSNPRPTMTCPECNEMYRGGMCPNCDYEPERGQRETQGLTFDGQELVEIERTAKSKKPKKKQTSERILVSSLYRGAKRMTWRQVMGMAISTAKAQGTTFKCPPTFTVAGTEYHSVEWGHPDGNRRVSALYEFLQRR